MTFIECCATGLASFMIGVNTLTVTVFFAGWLHRHATETDDTFKADGYDDPLPATAFCVLSEKESPPGRHVSSAIKVPKAR